MSESDYPIKHVGYPAGHKAMELWLRQTKTVRDQHGRTE